MTTAIGLLSEPLATVRRMVAASTSFQAWVGASDATSASAAVYLVTSPRHPRPRFALVDLGEFGRDRVVVTTARRFAQREGSTILVYLRADVDEADHDDALLGFCNAVGGIWSDLEEAAGVISKRNLSIRAIDLVIAPTRIVPEKRERAGDYFETAFSLSYARQP
jgi:hypothetical protein